MNNNCLKFLKMRRERLMFWVGRVMISQRCPCPNCGTCNCALLHDKRSKTLIHISWRNKKFSRQAKVKGIYHHQASFMPNAKGISLRRKHKRRKRPTGNKPQRIKKIVIGS